MIPKKNTIALSTLSFSAAIGLALIPIDSMAQRSGGGRGDDSRDSNSRNRETPSVTNERGNQGGSQFYYNDTNRNDSGNRYGNSNRYDSSNRYSQSSRGGSHHMEARMKKDVALINDLAGKMVWRARYDMIRNRDGSGERTYKAVSNHAVLTGDLVKASHGTCPVALKKAAIAVDNNIKMVIERRTSRLQGSRTCGTVTDPVLTLLNESKYPSSKVVQHVNRSSSRGPASYTPHRSVPTANVYTRPVAVREVTPADLIFTLFRKHIK